MRKWGLLVLGVLFSWGLTAQTILLEDFNSGIPGSWTIIDSGATSHTWFWNQNGRNGNFIDGSPFAFVDRDAAPSSVDSFFIEILETPPLNTTSYSTVFLEFDHYYRDYSLDTGWVDVWNGNAWVNLAFYSSNTGAWGNPDHPVFNLTPYKNANMKVRFRYEDNRIWAWWWAVDNVRLWSPLQTDGEVTQISSPVGGCGLTSNENVTITIKNQGLDTLSGFTASYQINGFSIITEPVSGSVLPGDSLVYTFATGANLSTGGVYDFSAWVNISGDGNATNDTVSGYSLTSYEQQSAFPYLENFEQGQAGWFSDGTNSTWAFGTPAKDVIIGAASGSNAWVTGGLGTGNHLNFDESYVYSRCLDLSQVALPVMALDVWWNSEFSYDGAAVQASSDGGASWVTIGNVGDPGNWYNDGTISGAPGGQQEGWSGRNSSNNGSGGWLTATHEIFAFSGQAEVIFRVAFGSDYSVTDDGFAFDNFLVSEAPVVSLGNDTLVCDSIRLDAGNGAAWQWSTGDSTRFLNADTSGSYSVTVTDSLGFTGTDVINITVTRTDQLNLGPDTLICPGETLNLFAGNGGTGYNWSNGAMTSSVNVNATGDYSVSVTYPGGCLATDTIRVDVSQLNADFFLADDTVCRGNPVYFSDQSTSATTWWWDFGDGSFSSNMNPVHAYFSGGTYPVKLTVSDGNCEEERLQYLYVDICTGTREIPQIAFRLFPNPAHDRVKIELNTELAGTRGYEMVNMSGQTVMEGEFMGNATELSGLDRLPQGKYLFRLRLGEDFIETILILM